MVWWKEEKTLVDSKVNHGDRIDSSPARGNLKWATERGSYKDVLLVAGFSWRGRCMSEWYSAEEGAITCAS